jgi:hypothetical protein
VDSDVSEEHDASFFSVAHYFYIFHLQKSPRNLMSLGLRRAERLAMTGETRNAYKMFVEMTWNVASLKT